MSQADFEGDTIAIAHFKIDRSRKSTNEVYYAQQLAISWQPRKSIDMQAMTFKQAVIDSWLHVAVVWTLVFGAVMLLALMVTKRRDDQTLLGYLDANAEEFGFGITTIVVAPMAITIVLDKMYPSGLHLWDKILDATPEWLTFALIILAIAAAYVGIIAGTILLFLYACPPTRNKWREWRLFSFLAGIAVLFVTVAVRLSNN